MRPLDRQYAFGEITSEEYVKATGAKPYPFKTRRERMAYPASDRAAFTAFREFLKHAGPAPKPVTEKKETPYETE
jgi:hypothetical protein